MSISHMGNIDCSSYDKLFSYRICGKQGILTNGPFVEVPLVRISIVYFGTVYEGPLSIEIHTSAEKKTLNQTLNPKTNTLNLRES